MLAALIAESALLWPPPFGLTDHLVTWYVGHTIVTGGSPYDPAVWTEAAARYDSFHLSELASGGGVGVWPYPPWTGLLFVPFGLLPVEIGPWALHVAYVASGIAAAILIARELPWRREASMTTALVALVAFEPFVVAARWGQFSGFLLLGVALLLAGLRSGATAPIVAGALLIATKPHLTVLIGIAAAWWLVRERRWRALVVTTAVIGAVVAISWALYPDWTDAATIGAGDRLAALPRFASTWAFAILVGGRLWPAVAAALIACAIGCCVYALRASPPSLRIIASFVAAAVATLAITPYSLVYDHLLLAPGLAYAVLAADSARAGVRIGMQLAVLVLGVITPWIVYLVVIFRPDQAPAGAVALVFAVLLLASARLLRSAHDRAPQSDERHMPQDHGDR